MSKAVLVESLLSGLVDASGNPLSAGKVYTYDAGTTTPRSLYTDKDASSAAANPLILGANGTYQAYAYGSYKFVVKTSADVTVATYDNLLFSPDILTWVPTFSASGAMTISASTVYQAWYFTDGDFVFHSVSGFVTTAGVASTSLFYTFPINSNNTPTAFASAHCDTGVAGVAALSDTTKGYIQRYDVGNWSIGASKVFSVSGWYRRA